MKCIKEKTDQLQQNKSNIDLAEEFLSLFPNIDRAELLKNMVGICFHWMRWGTDRKQRFAYDFLLEVKNIAKDHNKLD